MLYRSMSFFWGLLWKHFGTTAYWLPEGHGSGSGHVRKLPVTRDQCFSLGTQIFWFCLNMKFGNSTFLPEYGWKVNNKCKFLNDLFLFPLNWRMTRISAAWYFCMFPIYVGEWEITFCFVLDVKRISKISNMLGNKEIICFVLLFHLLSSVVR